jgi:hypothetical protein
VAGTAVGTEAAVAAIQINRNNRPVRSNKGLRK